MVRILMNTAGLNEYIYHLDERHKIEIGLVDLLWTIRENRIQLLVELQNRLNILRFLLLVSFLLHKRSRKIEEKTSKIEHY